MQEKTIKTERATHCEDTWSRLGARPLIFYIRFHTCISQHIYILGCQTRSTSLFRLITTLKTFPFLLFGLNQKINLFI